jgi:ABC-type oligopeptide transport system substrate-binding subunit
MRRFVGLALLVATALSLAACGGSLFGSSSSSSSSAPTQSSYQYNGSRDAGALGPSTHDQNRD